MNDMSTEEYWENLVKRSLCRFLLLSELAKEPLHGYAVNQAIKEACQGCCEPTEAMVYSTMKELQDNGYVESRMEEHQGRRRRVCWLTPSGEEAFPVCGEGMEANVARGTGMCGSGTFQGMNRRRLLARLTRGSVHNVDFLDMVNLIEGFGFRLIRINGSHHIFGLTGLSSNINIQPDKGDAKPYQIRQFLRLVERYRLTLEDEE